MRNILHTFILTGLLLLLAGCASWKDARETADADAPVFPDYKDVGSVGNKIVKLVSLPNCEKYKLKDDAAASF